MSATPQFPPGRLSRRLGTAARNFSGGALAVSLAIGAAVATAGGCDDKSSTPAPKTETSAPADGSSSPATRAQDLTYEKFVVAGLPITMQIPNAWKLNSFTPSVGAKTIFTLDGPTPGGEISIQFSVLPPHSEEILKQIRDGVPQENKDPSAHVISTFRDVDQARVYDRREFMSRPTTQPGEQTLEMIDWSITIFVPIEDREYQTELLSLMLPREQYEHDKDLLEKVFNSIAYDPLVGQ